MTSFIREVVLSSEVKVITGSGPSLDLGPKFLVVLDSVKSQPSVNPKVVCTEMCL